MEGSSSVIFLNLKVMLKIGLRNRALNVSLSIYHYLLCQHFELDELNPAKTVYNGFQQFISNMNADQFS